MVAFPEAREVSARRRHLHVNVGSCGDPVAGPRHGGRPARPPHHLAAAAAPRAARHRAAAAAAAARLAAPRSLARSALKAQHALRTPP